MNRLREWTRVKLNPRKRALLARLEGKKEGKTSAREPTKRAAKRSFKKQRLRVGVQKDAYGGYVKRKARTSSEGRLRKIKDFGEKVKTQIRCQKSDI